MATNIYGELIKAQLQNSATDLTPVSTGLFYFNTTTGLKWYTGTVWKIAADLDSSQSMTNKLISSTATLTGALTLPIGTEAQRPGSPVDGMVRYNSDSGSFEGRANGTWSGIGGGGTTDLITQASHGFAVGDVLYLSGSTYTKAIATAANTAEVVGMVSRVISATQFELTLSGEVSGLTGLTAGEVYFLSPTTPGALTVTEPTTIGHVSLPVGVASSSTTLYVAPKRGVIVGGVNARTQIPLANNATTTVQNVAAYEAGELSGWIAISATTPLKFYVTAQFSKNGAGNNYNISYQTSGDTPPVGFVLQVTSAGLIQAVLPSITGFTSASITYGLDVAAIGTTFPLSLDASLISGNFSNVNFTNRIFGKQSGLNNFEMGFGAGTGNTDFFGLYGAANKNIALFANEQQQMLVTGQGVQIRGRTDGAAVQTGYVGEVIRSHSASTVNLSSGSWNQITSITLSSGLWLVSYSNKYFRNGSTPSFEINIASSIGASTADISSNYTNKYQFRSASQILFNPATSLVEHIFSMGGIFVRSDGTNLYFADGTAITSSSQTLILATFSNIYTGAIPQVLGFRLEAIRIA